MPKGPFASSVGCGRAEPEWASLNLVKETVGIDSIEVSLWQTLRRLALSLHARLPCGRRKRERSRRRRSTSRQT